MNVCKQCQSDIVAPVCVSLEDTETEFNNLEEFILSVNKDLESLKTEFFVDMKSLSNEELTNEEVLQLLTDEIIKLKNSSPDSTLSTSSSTDCKLDWSPITLCETCSNDYCNSFQKLIDIVGQLKMKIDEL